MSVPSMEELARTICLAVWNHDYTPRDPKHPDERWAQALAAARAVLDRLKPVVEDAFMQGVQSEHDRQSGVQYALAPRAATRIIDQIKGA